MGIREMDASCLSTEDREDARALIEELTLRASGHRMPVTGHATLLAVAQSLVSRTLMKASWGIWTLPTLFMRFLPSFWRLRTFILRVTSPP